MRYFPFEPCKAHETFKVTFLQSVILKLEYDPENESYESFAHFFKSTFKLDLTQQQYNLKNTDAIRLRSDNKAFRAKFSKDTVELVINGGDYVNYDSSLKPFIDHLADFFKYSDAPIRNISIEKVDIWPLVKGVVNSPEDFFNTIFSKELLSAPDFIRDNQAFVEYNNPESQDNLLIRFAYIPYSENFIDQPPRIVLDTLCKHDGQLFNGSQMEMIAHNINNILYDAYMWSVNEEVIKIMNR